MADVLAFRLGKTSAFCECESCCNPHAKETTKPSEDTDTDESDDSDEEMHDEVEVNSDEQEEEEN